MIDQSHSLDNQEILAFCVCSFIVTYVKFANLPRVLDISVHQSFDIREVLRRNEFPSSPLGMGESREHLGAGGRRAKEECKEAAFFDVQKDEWVI